MLNLPHTAWAAHHNEAKSGLQCKHTQKGQTETLSVHADSLGATTKLVAKCKYHNTMISL